MFHNLISFAIAALNKLKQILWYYQTQERSGISLQQSDHIHLDYMQHSGFFHMSNKTSYEGENLLFSGVKRKPFLNNHSNVFITREMHVCLNGL